MKILNHIIKQACSSPKTIVLAEGDDQRIIQAAVRATHEGIANCILVGNPETIKQQAIQTGCSLEGVSIENPRSSTRSPVYAQSLLELRAKNGMTADQAHQLVLDPLQCADRRSIVRSGVVGFV